MCNVEMIKGSPAMQKVFCSILQMIDGSSMPKNLYLFTKIIIIIGCF